jgi:hypothetical protein
MNTRELYASRRHGVQRRALEQVSICHASIRTARYHALPDAVTATAHATPPEFLGIGAMRLLDRDNPDIV